MNKNISSEQDTLQQCAPQVCSVSAEKTVFLILPPHFLRIHCVCKILAMVKTIVWWIGTAVTLIIICARKILWEEEALYGSLSISACCPRAPSQPCSQAFQLLLPWCHRSSYHCQVGNLVTAGAVLRRGGSSSNTSTGLVRFTRPAELIALSSSEIDINPLELNEACWCRNKEAALMQLLLPRLQFFWIKLWLPVILGWLLSQMHL